MQTQQHISISNNNNAIKHSEFHQPQQHQLQIQINGGKNSEQIAKLPVAPVKGVKATQVTLSAAGPITDL